MITMDMVKSSLTAKFGGVAIPKVQEERLATCMSCEFKIEERRNSLNILDYINGKSVSNPYYYCKECGCPRVRFYPDSELRKKVTFNKAACPKNKWKE